MPAGSGFGGMSSTARLGWARGEPVAEAEPRPSTPWSFKLLAVFLLLLYANLPIVFPQLAAVAPAQVVALGALALLFVERAVARRPFTLSWPESHLLLAFLGVVALSSFTSLWPAHALEQTLLLLRYVVVYLLIVNTVESWRRLRVLFAVMVAGGLFPALGSLHYAGQGVMVEGNRAGWVGIFSNPNDLAYSLVLLFPLALALAFDTRGWKKLLPLGAAALFAVAIFATYSRGGLLGFGAVLLLAFLLWSPPVARLPGLVVGVAALAFAVTTFWDRDEGFADLLADATLQQRLDTIRAGIAMFADNPLLGVGPGCSVIGWPEYAPPNAFSEGWLHSHNTVIQLFSETGLLGAVPFFLLLGIALWRAHAQSRLWRAAGRPGRSRMVSALAISLWGLAVCGLSGGYMLSWFPYLILGLASATLLLPGPGEEEGAEDDDEAWR